MFSKHLKRLNFLLIAVILIVIGTGNIVIGSHKLETTIHELSRLQNDVTSNVGGLTPGRDLLEERREYDSGKEGDGATTTNRVKEGEFEGGQIGTEERKERPGGKEVQKVTEGASTSPQPAEQDVSRPAPQQTLRRLEELNRRVSYNRTVIFVGKAFIFLGILAAIGSLLSLGRSTNPNPRSRKDQSQKNQ